MVAELDLTEMTAHLDGPRGIDLLTGLF